VQLLRIVGSVALSKIRISKPNVEQALEAVGANADSYGTQICKLSAVPQQVVVVGNVVSFEITIVNPCVVQ
jgi:hypothetical protein